MYSSTIQFSETKSEAKTGFSLESMGRAVNEPSKYEAKESPSTYQGNANQKN
jgi:hypothetical protein